jgi:hypothetical protein
MTNYEQLFQTQIQNSHFAKAYHEARIDRIVAENLLNENRRSQIVREAQEAHREFELGQCKPITPNEFVNEIIS